MLQTIEKLHPLGLDFISYERGLKGPRIKEWQLAPKKSLRALQAAINSSGSCNIGIRLGGWSKIGDRYLVALDVDIRDVEQKLECHGWLDEHLPFWRHLPSVVSGSGGESRHIYCTFAKSPTKTRVTMAKGNGWSVDVRGNEEGKGCQNVWPGSLHPDGGIYRFEREFDIDAIMQALEDAELIGDCPTGLEAPAEFEAEVFAKIGESAKWVNPEGDDPDDLLTDVLRGPLDGFSIDDARSHLKAFDGAWWDDRDTWRDTGMALAYQFDSSEPAFDLWCEFSKLSEKFDARVAQQQWKSFKPKIDGKTMRGIIREANIARARNEWSPADDLDDDEDLIGDILPTPSKKEPETAKKPKSKAEKEVEFDEDWLEKLVKVKKKKQDDEDDEREPDYTYVPGLYNAELIVANDPRLRGCIAFNQFKNQIMLVKKAGKKRGEDGKFCVQLNGPGWKLQDKANGDLWSDTRENNIRSMLEAPRWQGGWGMKLSDRDLRAAIDTVADRRAYHPVRDFIEREEWDGVCLLDHYLVELLGLPDTPYHRLVGRLILVGAVTRVYEPGHKFDFVPIIEGAQGRGKTTFINSLAANWSAELSSEFGDDKRMVESMQGAWIIEIGELSGFNRHDTQQIKAFVSRQTDKVRMAYARNVSEFPRQCIFIGSTNDSHYLRDETGNRRYWPLRVGKHIKMIDNAKLRAMLPQLLAEALVTYKAMRAAQPHGDLPLYLTDPDAAAEAVRMQEMRRIETSYDVTEATVREWLDTPIKGAGMDEDDGPGITRNVTCLKEIAIECLGVAEGHYAEKPHLSAQLCQVMGRIEGWDSTGDRVRFANWGRQRAYARIPDESSAMRFKK